MIETFGVVFTPLKYGKNFVHKFNLCQKWLEGKTILDPTMGSGNLLEALISVALDMGISKNDLPLKRLFGIEIMREYTVEFFHRIEKKYKISFPKENIIVSDLFKVGNSLKVDIILGNPPWSNYNDLPTKIQKSLKPLFQKYSLIGDNKDLLLGCSRIDTSALTIQKVMLENLKENGEAVFFIPLSLLLNSGAHQRFRQFKIQDISYSLETIYDLNNVNAFPNVGTRYGLIHLKRDKETSYPLPYFIYENSRWKKQHCQPLFSKDGALSITSNSQENKKLLSIKKIPIDKAQTPRQGINSCGANRIFFFKEALLINNNYQAVNGYGETVLLPRKYLFPLISSSNFRQKNILPEKWVLLPYKSDGKVLSIEEMKKEDLLLQYLSSYKDILMQRKGVMINQNIKRGLWWALLGVGSYNFKPYKIVWEAYGKDTFNPMLFSGRWQGNQSLQAYMSFSSEEKALETLKLLKTSLINDYLLSFKMAGTMNWAQPGKVKEILHIT